MGVNDLVSQISEVQSFIRLIFLSDTPETISARLPQIFRDVLVIIEHSNESGQFDRCFLGTLFRNRKKRFIKVLPFPLKFFPRSVSRGFLENAKVTRIERFS